MKKHNNFLKFSIVFRCDAAELPEIGSGHLFRSLVIAYFLKKKFKLRFKEILFLVKTKKKFKKSLEILKHHKFAIKSIEHKIKDYSKLEAKIIGKFYANLLIIDRLGNIKKEFIDNIYKNYKKKIIIDDSSNYRKMFDLSLNPLIQNVKKFNGCKVGFKYQILNNKIVEKTKKNINCKNIFIFFGGFDSKKIAKKVLKSLENLNLQLIINLPSSYKSKINIIKSKHKINYFNPESYSNKLVASNIAIIAGGLSLFDAILNKKKIICIPQYKHQEINAKIISKTNAINYINFYDEKFTVKLINIFKKIYKNKKYEKKIQKIQGRIINRKKVKNNLNLISNLYKKSIKVNKL